MHSVPPALQRLIVDLNRLPGIGKKTATRLALYILRQPVEEARNLARDLAELHPSIRLCSHCFGFSETDPCLICADPRRDQDIICVVEETDDLMAIEKAAVFKGVYHILHGTLSPMDGIGPEELKIDLLIKRVGSRPVREIIIATSSTVPGEATASYLVDRLANESVLVSRIACGIPMGMDIKYADEMTLARAIETRSQAKRY